MRVFHSPSSALHDPKTFFRRGKLIPAPEGVERYTVLRDAVAADHDLFEAPDAGLAPVLAVHDAGYVEFLRTAWDRRAEVGLDGDELVTTQFARHQMHRLSGKLANQIGYYTADTSVAIRAGTWQAAYGSAQAAVAAAHAALSDGLAYALARPPGHHAFADCAGGFCYLNSTAIAAQSLRALTGGRVAVVDPDVHHGNGTQGIFYSRSDVLTTSVHADPSNYFPLYAGYADETGEGEGHGFNLNLPLAHGAGDSEVLAALETALDRVRAFKPAAMVVALGLDAAKDDPLGVFNVSAEGFAEIARRLSALNLPTVFVQEGGYLCPALPLNLKAVLTAAEATR
ncbi:MAG TPA: histone deacetylase family protein [Caulobacteraceae bacterium]|jgi:acetoin utilization deacetylase AcuC-like enzyme|nr:histone deacetylase family protein [Caulobacteraceae bacterium]